MQRVTLIAPSFRVSMLFPAMITKRDSMPKPYPRQSVIAHFLILVSSRSVHPHSGQQQPSKPLQHITKPQKGQGTTKTLKSSSIALAVFFEGFRRILIHVSFMFTTWTQNTVFSLGHFINRKHLSTFVTLPSYFHFFSSPGSCEVDQTLGRNTRKGMGCQGLFRQHYSFCVGLPHYNICWRTF